MSMPIPYDSWSTDPQQRWIDAANVFGYHLMQASLKRALERVPATASAECQDIARQAALDAIYGVLMLLDGVADSELPCEGIELAPDGDGLCMGFHGWVEGDFGESSD